MNHIKAFYTIEVTEEIPFAVKKKTSPSFTHAPMNAISYRLESWGDFFLQPARDLFHGKTIAAIRTYALEKGIETFPFDKLVATPAYIVSQKKLTLFQLIKAILLIPGITVGTIFKGIALCSSAARERHQLAAKHLTPIQQKEVDVSGCSFHQIKEKLADPYRRKIEVLILRGKGENFEPGDDIGLSQIEIGKMIIFNGVGFSHSKRSYHPGIAESLVQQGFENRPLAPNLYLPEIDDASFQVVAPVRERNQYEKDYGKIIGYYTHTFCNGQTQFQTDTTEATPGEYSKAREVVEDQNAQRSQHFQLSDFAKNSLLSQPRDPAWDEIPLTSFLPVRDNAGHITGYRIETRVNGEVKAVSDVTPCSPEEYWLKQIEHEDELKQQTQEAVPKFFKKYPEGVLSAFYGQMGLRLNYVKTEAIALQHLSKKGHKQIFVI